MTIPKMLKTLDFENDVSLTAMQDAAKRDDEFPCFKGIVTPLSLGSRALQTTVTMVTIKLESTGKKAEICVFPDTSPTPSLQRVYITSFSTQSPNHRHHRHVLLSILSKVENSRGIDRDDKKNIAFHRHAIVTNRHSSSRFPEQSFHIDANEGKAIFCYNLLY